MSLALSPVVSPTVCYKSVRAWLIRTSVPHNCVTRAPLLYFIRTWVALSFICESVCQASETPVQISTLCNKGINGLYWPSIINYQLLPPHSVLILTQYTASSSRNAQLSQLDLVWIASCSWVEYKFSARWKNKPLKFKPANLRNQSLSKVSQVLSSRSILQLALLASELRQFNLLFCRWKFAVSTFNQGSNYPKSLKLKH